MPAYEQNASHSAQIFRGAVSAPYGAAGGILGTGELAITQSGTPAMSVVVGAGRAMIAGTAVSPPSGFSWTTQFQYFAYNDGPLTLTIATSSPTNPRIDLCVLSIQDSFYSGGSNQALAQIVTGTPAVSPVAPAAPANSIILAQIAVAANATTIVTANITQEASLVTVVNTASAASVLGPLTAHAIAVNRVLSATNTFSNPTTPTVFPVSADATALQSTFVKNFASTKMLVRVAIPLSFTSGSGQNFSAQVSINAVSYTVATALFPTSVFDGWLVGEIAISGVAAGSYATFPTVQSTGASAIVGVTGTQVSYSITEIG